MRLEIFSRNMSRFTFAALIWFVSTSAYCLDLSLKQSAINNEIFDVLEWQKPIFPEGPGRSYNHDISYDIQAAASPEFSSFSQYKAGDTQYRVQNNSNASFCYRVRATWVFYRDMWRTLGDWSNTVCKAEQ